MNEIRVVTNTTFFGDGAASRAPGRFVAAHAAAASIESAAIGATRRACFVRPHTWSNAWISHHVIRASRSARSVIDSEGHTNYFHGTDLLYIDLRQQPSVESIEVADGIVLDFGASGELVGIDIDNASRTVDLDHLILTRMHAQIERIAS